MPADDRPPYFPFFPSDFLADEKVALMTAEEIGAYILLLCRAWSQNPPASLPNDENSLATWAKMRPGQWNRASERVLLCWELRDDNRWYQKRLESEHRILIDRIRHRSEAGQRGNKVRWQSDRSRIANGSQCDRNAIANGSHPNPNPNPNSIPPLRPPGGAGESGAAVVRKRRSKIDRFEDELRATMPEKETA